LLLCSPSADRCTHAIRVRQPQNARRCFAVLGPGGGGGRPPAHTKPEDGALGRGQRQEDLQASIAC
jgi:hypothetical protein